MNLDRIKEIHEATAYPESESVMLALTQVWNECEQEYNRVKNNAVLPLVSGCSSCGCREYDYVEDVKICAYCEEPL